MSSTQRTRARFGQDEQGLKGVNAEVIDGGLLSKE